MKTRKFLTLLLAVVLTLALLPSPALAASPGGAAPAAGDVCEIGSTGYATLDDAVAAVVSGQTIKLIDNITTSVDIAVSSGDPFTIDTNGKQLTFGAGFYVDGGSDVTIAGNVRSDGGAMVTASDGAKLTITGNFTATGATTYVLDCWDSGSILYIGGNVIGTGVHAGWGSTVTVAGSISAGGYGVTCDGGSVEAGDINVTVFNGTAYGVYCSSGTVTGNITVDGESGAVGVFGIGSADVTVTGNVTVTSSGNDAVGVQSEPDNVLITVMGNVSVSGTWSTGVLDDGYGEVSIKGNVTATGADSVGAHAKSPDGFITVDGTITADGDRILLDTEVFDMDADSDKAGYDQYSNSSSGGSAYVWVKIPAPPAKPTPPAITTASLPGGVNGTAYSTTLAATGTAPITWGISSGRLPPGLSLNSATGVISGKLTANGTFTFTVNATNLAGSDTKTFSIVVKAPTEPTKKPPEKDKNNKPAVVKYKVTFDANGGKIGQAKSRSVKITKGKPLGKLPTVANSSNYTFKGWFTSKAGGKKVTASTKVTKNMTVYAHWQKKTLYGKVVKTAALYVRTHPSMHVNLVPTIGYLKGGTIFRIASFVDNPGKGNDWYKLKYKGKVRYLFAKYVKTFYK